MIAGVLAGDVGIFDGSEGRGRLVGAVFGGGCGSVVRGGGGVLLITDVDALLPAEPDPVATLILAVAALGALLLNRRLPG